MAEIQKRFLKGWDWNSNEKNPSSIATGLLTTVFLMGIMTQFLETILLQLIKLTLRGLFQPSNDYFFFHGKVGKVIWKEFGDPFFFIFWCWWLWVETRTGSTDLSLGAELKRRGDKHWGPSLQENMDKNLSNSITPHINLFPFHISFLYSYCFLPHLEFLFVFDLQDPFSKK